jgi:hypothetical protein
MSVKIRSGCKSTEFEGSPPQPLFQTAILSALSGFFCGYDVSIDGQRFLINTVPGEGVHATVNVVVNWQAGLKQ